MMNKNSSKGNREQVETITKGAVIQSVIVKQITYEILGRFFFQITTFRDEKVKMFSPNSLFL